MQDATGVAIAHVLQYFSMSIRENIELYGPTHIDKFLAILSDEYGARPHSSQPNAYLLEGLPFYQARQAGDHVSILSFNNVPLPALLVEALVSHPELFSDELRIRWTQEQDLIIEATLGQIRGQQSRHR